MPFAYVGAAVSVASAVSGLVGGASNSSAASTAADGQTAAAQITADANAKALDKQIAFSKQAQDEIRAASGRGLTDIDKGVADYTGTVTPLLNDTPVTLPQYRGLTAAQETGEADLLRQGNASLAASGLRGDARAGIGAVLDQVRRYREDAASTNDASNLAARQQSHGVQNQARSGLAGIQAGAGGSKANTELLTGNNLASSFTGLGQSAANLTQATGAAGANAAINSANTRANATTANGNLFGSTLGSTLGNLSFGGNPNVPAGGGGGGGYSNGPIDTGSFDGSTTLGQYAKGGLVAPPRPMTTMRAIPRIGQGARRIAA